jgi:hypothetical protein
VRHDQPAAPPTPDRPDGVARPRQRRYDRGMARLLACALVAGCSSVAIPGPAPAIRHPAQVHADRRIFRQLRVGKSSVATRTTFELVIDSGRATLVEIDEQAARARSVAEADRQPRWAVVAQRTYRGLVTPISGAVELALESEGVQPLQLHCAQRAVDAAGAGAVHVPSPDRPPDGSCGDRGASEPVATSSVQALVCDAGVADPDGDDDDRLVFADPPGLEHVLVSDDCLRDGGLRILR